ncbi:unnamed protein product [Psylliodes chrysocephalus]|uniref:Carboxylesterase type B domain-containing protein n=1 Tax=Psylliodes chrysocephalus TaxID=3402493 RepID=A0A9P0GEP5_9CUCU|nr:unnamed protein product [Psylliodes chrysocephala]
MNEEIVVNTENGRIRGKKQKDYHGGRFYSFSGIPYAKAPVGELRFRAPQPSDPWEDIRDGTKEGYECPSLDMFFGYHVGNEDNCLNLNVYTKELPNAENDKKKPVMVFIHGGGFMYGSNKSAVIGPHYLMTEDIVFVTINYRLGVFGLFHKAIMQSGCALNPWARGRKNFSDIAKAMGYKDVDEKTLFQKLCRASARSLVSAQFKIEDVSI